jgi:GNAT superfamily N-acetyltransferase
MTSYTTHTLVEKQDYREKINRLSDEAWPAFLQHGDITRWGLLFEMFPAYQLLLCDPDGSLAAVGHTVPITWDGRVSDLPQTIEDILIRAERTYEDQKTPNTLCALAAMVSAEYQGKGLSSKVIREMKAVASEHGCSSLIAPLRPVWKSRYPLIPMERYVTWQREDGAPLDPWIRVHRRLDAEALCVAPNTLTVEGSIADWESWTGMTVNGSGLYLIPGALQPVKMDCESDVGRYEDPNYWMKHPVR